MKQSILITSKERIIKKTSQITEMKIYLSQLIRLIVDLKLLRFSIKWLTWIMSKSCWFATILTWYIDLLMFVELAISLILWCMSTLTRLKNSPAKSRKNGFIVKRLWLQKTLLLWWLKNNWVWKQIKTISKRHLY